MEKLRMYNPLKKEEKEPLKTPQLTIKGKEVVAVNEDGETIAFLYNLGDRSRALNTKKTLIAQGYRTNWAKWTDAGAFDGLIEDIEG